MKNIKLPYGKGTLEANIPDDRFNGCLVSKMTEYVPEKGQTELVKEALEHPIGTPKLSDMAIGKKKVVIISSDHTRPVPSKIIMPLLLEEVHRVFFLQKRIAHVFLIGKDGLYGADIPGVSASGRFPSPSLQFLRDRIKRKAGKEELVYKPDGLRLFFVDGETLVVS